MKGWQHAHEMVKKVKAANLSREALEQTLGVVIGMLNEGGKDMEDIKAGADLMLAFRQENGVEEFLETMKKAEKEMA